MIGGSMEVSEQIVKEIVVLRNGKVRRRIYILGSGMKITRRE
jgi:hypothetical protein